MLLVWCWIRGPRLRLRPGIEGRVNRWWAGGSRSSPTDAKPPVMAALIHPRWKPRSLRCVGGCASWRRRTSFGKSQRLLRLWAPQHQRLELTDTQKATYALNRLDGQDYRGARRLCARKHRAAHRGQRALARRRPDDAMAWEYEAQNGAYSDPRIRQALMRDGVDAGVRAVAASMRRHGRTGFNTRPRPDRRVGQPPVTHEEHCNHH